MSKSIYADVNSDETRVAIVKDGKLLDLDIRRVEENKSVGNIYLGIVTNVVAGINSCFVDIGKGKNVFLPISDYQGDIRKGESVMIQVNKEEIHDKGAKVTGKISLPGRSIVFMPTEPKIGVSKNIKDVETRKILKEILSSVAPKGTGFVARTNAEKKSKKMIIREAKFLIKKWDTVHKNYKKALKNKKPCMIYEESDLVTYAAREYLDESTVVFFVNDKTAYKKVIGYVNNVLPEFKGRVVYYESDVPLFEKHKLEIQIENLKKRTINLDCGGYIILEQTEALTAIDVNTGSFTKGLNRESTAMKVNEEAAFVSAQQILLRDIGGIIIIDFIDLDMRKNRERLFNILKNEMSDDKAKTTIYPMTRLGLIEMTRQRRKESIVKIICSDCPYCGGSGMIFSGTTMYIKIKRELLLKGPGMPGKFINLFLHPRVAEVFDEKGTSGIEKVLKKKIKLRRDYKLHHEEFKITA
ncbi:MAG: Rne/Rng family ribonuclease [Elusimicrobiota bacterium]